MPQITGGKISYGRTIKTGDYESARSDAEFSFVVSEGEDFEKIADIAKAQAHGKVHDLLRLKTEPLAAAKPPTDKDKAAEKTAKTAEKPAAKPPAPATADPAAIDVVTDPKPAADVVVEDDPLGAVAPSKVTDEEMSGAITKKNTALGNPQKIRELVAKYAPQDGNPHSFRDVDQAKRAAFITELKALA